MGLTRTETSNAVEQLPSTTNPGRSSKNIDPDVRAARAVNEAFEGESRFPELDSYLSRM
jgi:hypothetical protein